MGGYQRQSTAAGHGGTQPGASGALGEAGAFFRRLIPFPGAEALSPLSLLPMPGQGSAPRTDAAGAVADMAGDPAASIVSQAASVLDDEMAKGVIAARRLAGTAAYEPDAGNPLLRQVHELVDHVAAAWPGLSGTQSLVPPRSVPNDPDPLAELKPRATVRPGQRATIAMTVSNSESRTVRLVPAATDLLGSRGGRIACSLLEFTPPEFGLEPGEQRDLTIATTVPLGTAPGCYSGLLVVSGVDYLRALVTIDVE